VCSVLRYAKRITHSVIMIKGTDEKQTVLIVDDDPDMLRTVGDIFYSDGYNVVKVNSAEMALKEIYTKTPHVILLDLMLPGMDGFELCRIIRQDIVLSHIPIVIVSGEKIDINNKLRGLREGAVDYITKPFEPLELLAKIKTLLRHTHYQLDANPLTKLPGNSSSISAIEACIHSNKLFAVCYADLDNFKAYNDTYGFEQGDKVIKFTADVIKRIFYKFKISGGFIGHLGGDDFIFITDPRKAKSVCSDIMKSFDKGIVDFYPSSDRKKRHIMQFDRKGRIKKYPLTTISVVVVHNTMRKVDHVGQISRIAAELKSYIKTFKGSNYIFDRRTDGKLDKRLSKNTKDINAKIAKLKSILSSGGIRVFLQPIISMKGCEVIGYEALMRGPVGTELENPELVFSLAQKAGLISALDRTCIESALNKGMEILKDHYLFINIKAETLADTEVLRQIFSPWEARIKKTRGVVIEVPEEGIYCITKGVEEGISYLRSIGVLVSIDDVGRGAMSLRDIAKIRPDFIKIDISLVRSVNTDTDRQNMLNSLLKFSKWLDAKVIAEGVELKEEYEYLLKKKVYYGQGYLFAKPSAEIIREIKVV